MDTLNPYAPPAVETREPGRVTCVFTQSRSRYLGVLCELHRLAGRRGELFAGLLSAGCCVVMFTLFMKLVGVLQQFHIVVLGFIAAAAAGVTLAPLFIRHHFVLPAVREDLAELEAKFPLAWGVWRVELGDQLRLTTPRGEFVWPWERVQRGYVFGSCWFLLVADDLPIPVPVDAAKDQPSQVVMQTLRERCPRQLPS